MLLLQGAWTPSLNIPTLLTTLRLLLANPNPDDPLMPDIVSPIINLYFIHVFQKLLLTYFYTEEYIHNNNFFISKARSLTKKHATSTIDEVHNHLRNYYCNINISRLQFKILQSLPLSQIMIFLFPLPPQQLQLKKRNPPQRHNQTM